MDLKLKKLYGVVSQRGGIFVFLRAQLSSQLASLSDFLITIVLANLFKLYYVYATFIGSVCGGVVNCIVNYKWTFKAMDVKKRYVAVKYLLVWICSILFNTGGTYVATELLGKIESLSDFDNRFIAAKIVVSLIVGYLWNYNMQRLFVYRDCKIRKIFFRHNYQKIQNND